jgi:hypothetical protein
MPPGSGVGEGVGVAAPPAGVWVRWPPGFAWIPPGSSVGEGVGVVAGDGCLAPAGKFVGEGVGCGEAVAAGSRFC